MNGRVADYGLWEPTEDMRRVRRKCAEVFGVDERAMLGRRRTRDLVWARQAACYVIREVFPRLSYPCVGAVMGGLDHSTVINACQQTRLRMARDPEVLGKVAALLVALKPERFTPAADSHVRAWRTYCLHLAMLRNGGRVPIAPVSFPPDSSLAEFAAPGRAFCAQCDRSVDVREAERCRDRRCALQGQQERAA